MREAEGTAASRRRRGGSCSPSAGACGGTSPSAFDVGNWGFFFFSLAALGIARPRGSQGVRQLRLREEGTRARGDG
jgi:hypothetical protein